MGVELTAISIAMTGPGTAEENMENVKKVSRSQLQVLDTGIA